MELRKFLTRDGKKVVVVKDKYVNGPSVARLAGKANDKYLFENETTRDMAVDVEELEDKYGKIKSVGRRIKHLFRIADIFKLLIASGTGRKTATEYVKDFNRHKYPQAKADPDIALDLSHNSDNSSSSESSVPSKKRNREEFAKFEPAEPLVSVQESSVVITTPVKNDDEPMAKKPSLEQEILEELKKTHEKEILEILIRKIAETKSLAQIQAFANM